MLLWLWHRPAAAAQFWPLAWELPYAVGTAIKKKKKKKNLSYPRKTRKWLKALDPFKHKNKYTDYNYRQNADFKQFNEVEIAIWS